MGIFLRHKVAVGEEKKKGHLTSFNLQPPTYLSANCWVRVASHHIFTLIGAVKGYMNINCIICLITEQFSSVCLVFFIKSGPSAAPQMGSARMARVVTRNVV